MVTNNWLQPMTTTAVMLSLLNNTLKDVAKRVSRIEANQARPSKRQRKNESSSDNASSEDDVSDSDKLVGKTDTVATSGTQESDTQREKPSDSDDPLLSEIAQDFDCGDDTGPNVSEKLAEIVNKLHNILSFTWRHVDKSFVFINIMNFFVHIAFL